VKSGFLMVSNYNTPTVESKYGAVAQLADERSRESQSNKPLALSLIRSYYSYTLGL